MCIRDSVTTPLPVNRKQASSLVSRLRGAALLEGVRGQAAGDIDALLNLLVALSHFALANAAVLEALDLNPVIVHPKNQGVTIADAVIVTRVCEVPS